MGRLSRKLKSGWNRFSKRVKRAWSFAKQTATKANDEYEKAKKFVSDHQSDLEKAKMLVRENGGKAGGKVADAIDKGQGYVKKGTDYVDKQRDKAKQVYDKGKQVYNAIKN